VAPSDRTSPGASLSDLRAQIQCGPAADDGSFLDGAEPISANRLQSGLVLVSGITPRARPGPKRAHRGAYRPANSPNTSDRSTPDLLGPTPSSLLA